MASRNTRPHQLPPPRPYPYSGGMMTPTTPDVHLRHYRHSQLSALAVELAYYLDHLYTTDTVNFILSPVTISHRAFYCDATTQTDPILSPPAIARSTQTPVRSLNYRYACGAYVGLQVNPVSPYAPSFPGPFPPPGPDPSSSNSSSPPVPSPLSLNSTSPTAARSPSPGCSYIYLD
ncbi:uncharacterized [Tachysurus ichikawai]